MRSTSPRHAGSGGEEGGEVALARPAEAPDGCQVLLPVEHDALVVHVAVEVDGELAHPQERPVDLRRGGRRRPPATAGRTGRGHGRATSSAARRRTRRPPAGANRGRRCPGSASPAGSAESVCAPTTRRPAWAGRLSGTRQAISAPPRMTKRAPATSSQAASSSSGLKPAPSRSAAASATAWYGEVDASR